MHVLLKFLVVLILLSPLSARAVDIQFPEEELARESVLPKFDNPEAVKRRAVDTEGRFEAALYGGWALNDALFNPMTFGGLLGYHFNELHAAQVQIGIFSTQPSQYVPGIENELPANERNLAKGPAVKSLFLGNYQITPFYGKLSITKSVVLNLSIFATAGVGTIQIGDGSSVAFGLGIGQKLYFSRNFGLRADLKALFYSAPNPLSIPITEGNTPANSEYEKQSVMNGLLTVAGIFLF